jgi:hypothetical protein
MNFTLPPYCELKQHLTICQRQIDLMRSCRKQRELREVHRRETQCAAHHAHRFTEDGSRANATAISQAQRFLL